MLLSIYNIEDFQALGLSDNVQSESLAGSKTHNVQRREVDEPLSENQSSDGGSDIANDNGLVLDLLKL